MMPNMLKVAFLMHTLDHLAIPARDQDRVLSNINTQSQAVIHAPL